MAKGNNNYIKNMINQYGENWIVALKPIDIQRSGKRVFKEMVKGQIDYQELGNYFMDGKFTDNLIIAASNELEINTLLYNALYFYKQYNPQIPNISTQLNHLQILCHIYQTIYNKLNMVKQTSNIGYLYDTSALLYSYRDHLNQ
jgi:hypothetical protein